MAQVKDAETMILGTVVAIELGRDFKTKKQDGTAKATVITGDAGFAVVKLDVDEFATIKPAIGSRVAWLIRNAAWKMEGNRSGMSSNFVRLADSSDIDLIKSITTAYSKPVAA